jgi:2'-deoxynucleoside 5'-phosphate N-hydrolase
VAQTRAFIAGPLLAAKNLDLEFYRSLGAVCSGAGIEPFLPHLAIDQHASPNVIFERDIDALKNCRLLIAEVSAPSHGVGGELMFASLKRIPIICLAENEAKVSVMVLGNSMLRDLIRYATRDNCCRELSLRLRSIDVS